MCSGVWWCVEVCSGVWCVCVCVCVCKLFLFLLFNPYPSLALPNLDPAAHQSPPRLVCASVRGQSLVGVPGVRASRPARHHPSLHGPADHRSHCQPQRAQAEGGHSGLTPRIGRRGVEEEEELVWCWHGVGTTLGTDARML